MEQAKETLQKWGSPYNNILRNSANVDFRADRKSFNLSVRPNTFCWLADLFITTFLDRCLHTRFISLKRGYTRRVRTPSRLAASLVCLFRWVEFPSLVRKLSAFGLRTIFYYIFPYFNNVPTSLWTIQQHGRA